MTTGSKYISANRLFSALTFTFTPISNSDIYFIIKDLNKFAIPPQINVR